MPRVSSIWLVTALAGVCLAASPEAAKLAKDAAAAEKKGEVVRAYLLWAEAAASDRTNPTYWQRAEALRGRAEVASPVRISHPELEQKKDAPAARLPEGGFTFQDLEDMRRMLPPPRLRPSADRHSFQLKANAKPLYEQVAAKLGYVAVFDKDFTPNGEVTFHIADAGYRDVLRALEQATNTFIVPVSENVVLVAQDTPQKRTELETQEAVAIPIPDRTTTQEAQELLTMVQQALEIKRAGVDLHKGMILLRDRVSKVEAARVLIEQLSAPKAQVAVDIEMLAAGATSSLSFGMDQPSKFPLVNFGHTWGSVPAAVAGFTRFLTFGGGATFLGLGITDAQLFATASRSSASSLMKTTLLMSDGQAAKLHVGNKFPVMTSTYGGYNGIPADSGGSTQVTAAVVSTASYSQDYSSAVSSTGKMKLVVNGQEFPLTVPDSYNNLATFPTLLNSLGAGVYSSVIAQGTTSKPLTLAIVATSMSVTTIRLVDDPDGAAIELMRSVNTASSISADYTNATTAPFASSLELTLKVGDQEYPITLTADENNLDGVRDAINGAGAGVKAAVLVSSLVTGTKFLQVVADTESTGTIQLTAGSTTLLHATNEVTYGAQLGQSVSSGSSTTATPQLYIPPPTFNFEDLGVILTVTPFVHGLEEVTLEVKAEFKSLGGGSVNGVPIISNRQFEGKVRLKNGEWAVLAGLLTETKTLSVSGIPGVKDIPGLGVLLRSNNSSSEADNILLVLKPSVRNLPSSESVGRTWWVGTETRSPSPL